MQLDLTNNANITIDVPRNWYKDGEGFFGKHYIEGDNSKKGYEETHRNLTERTAREVKGIIDLLNVSEGCSVLDCPCGYGRHSIALSKKGMSVTGVDINTDHLEIALNQDIESVNFLKKDMLNMNFENKFDAAINMFYSFGFFESDEENKKALKNFYNSLKPSGKFLMHTDVNIQKINSGKYKFEEVRELQNGEHLKIVERFDKKNMRMLGTWTIHRQDGSTIPLTPYSMRIFDETEFANWCLEVGFSSVDIYGDWDGSPLDSSADNMIIIATK